LEKILKKLILISIAAFSFNVMALTVELNLSTKGKTLLNETENETYVQTYSESSGQFTVSYIGDGNNYGFGQDIPISITNSDNISIQILKRDKKVRYIDTRENIDKVVPVKIKKTMFGNMKKLIIKEKTMKALYKDSLVREGLETLQTMYVNTEEMNIETSVKFSSLSCDATEEGLKCTQERSISLKAVLETPVNEEN
jgi:hypothetical protein